MPDLKNLARDLRINMTDAERKLWYAINRDQLGVKFRRQYSLAGYIVDFICVPKRLIIEVDGGQHADNENDLRRTAAIEAVGYNVLRFWNNEVLQNIDGVLHAIIEHLALS